MIKELDTYDWEEAFGYCGEPGTNGEPRLESAMPRSEVSLRPFTRVEVVEIRHSVEGENDGPPWRMVGRLNDGRWFYLEAGCDYTGWDCQAYGWASIAGSYADIIKYGCTDEARELFGIPHP